MKRGLSIAAVVALAAACSSSGNDSAKVPTAGPNPVALLRTLDQCHLPPGARLGSHDAFGNRMATCKITVGGARDEITVYTFTDDAARDRQLAADGTSSDDDGKVIIGERFVLIYSGTHDLGTGGTEVAVDPLVVARAVHGRLMR